MEKVKLWMHDRLIRRLANVRHVLSMGQNLTFLGALKAQGCMYIVVNGVLR